MAADDPARSRALLPVSSITARGLPRCLRVGCVLKHARPGRGFVLCESGANSLWAALVHGHIRGRLGWGPRSRAARDCAGLTERPPRCRPAARGRAFGHGARRHGRPALGYRPARAHLGRRTVGRLGGPRGPPPGPRAGGARLWGLLAEVAPHRQASSRRRRRSTAWPGRDRRPGAGAAIAPAGWKQALLGPHPSHRPCRHAWRGAACTIATFGRGRPYMAWPRAAGARMSAWPGPRRSDAADGLTAGRGRFKPCRGRPARFGCRPGACALMAAALPPRGRIRAGRGAEARLACPLRFHRPGAASAAWLAATKAAQFAPPGALAAPGDHA
jgi:hypothetical protein